MSRSAEHDGRNAALRQMFATTQLARDASQPTGATVPAECEKLNLPWAVEDIADSEGGKLHWLGDRKAENVLLYFHGELFFLVWTRCISKGSFLTSRQEVDSG